MTQQEIRDFLTPFQPLAVFLDNGDRFEIKHPDQMLTGPTTVIVASDNRFVQFSMRRITKIERAAEVEA